MYKVVYLFDGKSDLYVSEGTTFVSDRESAFDLCEVLYKSSKVYSVRLFDEYLHLIKVWGDL